MTERLTAEQAAALLHPTDVLGIPLGPGHPGAFLHALGARRDWEDLVITGALLTDFYEVFGQPGVRFLSGFYIDYLWHKSVGRGDVFWGVLRSQVFLFVVFGAAFIAVAVLNLVIADRLAPVSFSANMHPVVERFHEVFGRRLRLFRLAVPLPGLPKQTLGGDQRFVRFVDPVASQRPLPPQEQRHPLQDLIFPCTRLLQRSHDVQLRNR